VATAIARSDQAPQDDHRPSPSQEPPAVPATFLLDSEPLSPSKLPIPGSALPTLEISTDYLNSNPEHLSSLPPAQLLRELLGRIFTGGIGRLYFERCEAMGRILWSQNGVLQSVLSDLPLSSFQGVINELKQLTHLPMTPVQKPKQVEIERLCQQTRLLVRLRVMPNAHGEEATLQILHGAALKFYQQQQVANLSRDALNIAKDLQQKVREIHDRTQADAQLPDQANLTQVLQIIEQQIAALKQLE
jgi:type II secretory ATPase GspE/PulE/Tfp pilus assembly ATPase PilB-like protein